MKPTYFNVHLIKLCVTIERLTVAQVSSITSLFEVSETLGQGCTIYFDNETGKAAAIVCEHHEATN